MRMRSAALTRDCAAGFWCVRRRDGRVSITAATTATVRITAATSNGSMNWVNSDAPARWCWTGRWRPRPFSAEQPAGHCALTPRSGPGSASITTATKADRRVAHVALADPAIDVQHHHHEQEKAPSPRRRRPAPARCRGTRRRRRSRCRRDRKKVSTTQAACTGLRTDHAPPRNGEWRRKSGKANAKSMHPGSAVGTRLRRGVRRFPLFSSRIAERQQLRLIMMFSPLGWYSWICVSTIESTGLGIPRRTRRRCT